MKKFSLSYAFSLSLSGIVRTAVMSVATLLVLTGCLLVLGSLGLLQANYQANLSDYYTSGQAVVFLQSDCTEGETEQVRTLLESYKTEGLLVDYQYVSAEEALSSELSKFEDYPQLYQSLQMGANPYRASFVVTAKDGESLPALVQRLEGVSLTRTGEGGVSESFAPFATITSHEAAAATLEGIMGTVRMMALVLLLVLLLLSLFVLNSTVRLAIFGRRKEIAVMRYVGATHGFLTAPFLMQGIVLGFLSAALAFFLQWLFYRDLAASVAANYPMLTLLSFDAVWYYLLAAFLFVGLFVGVIGGLLSTGRYLKEKD